MSCPCCCNLFQLPCEVTLVHIDENRCEDDAFNLYIENPTTGAQRFVQLLDLVSSPKGCCNPSCPQTRIDVPVTITQDDVGTNCRFRVRLVFAYANCCGTLTRLRVIGANGQEILGTNFGSGGYAQEFSIASICGEAYPP